MRIVTIVGVFFFVFLGLGPGIALAATFTVTKSANTLDGTCDSDCSLREAIAAANAAPGADSIEFAIPTSDPNWNLNYPNAFELPFSFTIISDTLTIDGWSQARVTGDTNPARSEPATGPVTGVASTGPEIILTGLTNHSGVLRVTAPDVTIQGLGIYRNNINSASSLRVFEAYAGADNLTISGNTFALNGGGVFANRAAVSTFHYVDNVLTGNTHGGLDALELQFGDLLSAVIERNVIVGTHASAIQLAGHDGGESIIIRDNLFKANGQNTTESKAHIFTAASNTTPIIIENNTFSQTPTQSIIVRPGSRVTIRGNRFLDTDRQAIDLTPNTNPLAPGDGPSPNDPSDIDTGANDMMNYPIIDTIEHRGGDRYLVKGKLDSKDEDPYQLEICTTDYVDPYFPGCTKSLWQGRVDMSLEGHWQVEVEVAGTGGTMPLHFSSMATNVLGSTSEIGPIAGFSPSASSSKPELSITKGGTYETEQVVSIVRSDSFEYEVYLDHQQHFQPVSTQISINARRYWTMGDAHELWYRSSFNQAKVLESSQPYIVALKYNPDQLGRLNPRQLRLAYSEDGMRWKVLTESVVDPVNGTVAVVTKTGGWYRVVGRW